MALALLRGLDVLTENDPDTGRALERPRHRAKSNYWPIGSGVKKLLCVANACAIFVLVCLMLVPIIDDGCWTIRMDAI